MLPFNRGYWQVHSFGSKFPHKFRNWHLAGCALSDPRNWKIALQKKNVLQLIRLDLTLQVKDRIEQENSNLLLVVAVNRAARMSEV